MDIYISKGMSNILDQVFNEVCLDERITDGIFQMENSNHMDALRDYFLKKGITKEAAIHVTNRMVEGRFPERQAYNKDGILVTFPTPQHKARAISRGTHFEKNPVPQAQQVKKEEEPKQAPPGSNPEPGELPPDDEPEDDKDDDDEEDGGNSHGGGKEPTIFQGGKQLSVEPSRGEKIPEPPPQPPSSAIPATPRTPQRIAAEKEVVKQIFATDDTNLSNPAMPVTGIVKEQLQELFKKADEMGFREAVKFLSHYVKP